MKKQNIVDTGQIEGKRQKEREALRRDFWGSQTTESKSSELALKISSLTRIFLYLINFTNFNLKLNSTNGYDYHSYK